MRYSGSPGVLRRPHRPLKELNLWINLFYRCRNLALDVPTHKHNTDHIILFKEIDIFKHNFVAREYLSLSLYVSLQHPAHTGELYPNFARINLSPWLRLSTLRTRLPANVIMYSHAKNIKGCRLFCIDTTKTVRFFITFSVY